jgi:LCP family protein required for cell wall assembly
MKRSKLDVVRLLALLALIAAIGYFHLNIFCPRIIPSYLRVGMPSQRMNILVMGTDLVYAKETGKKLSESGRTDTLMLIHIDPLKGKINLLSIPRDTLAAIVGYGRTKINAAHFIGGPPLAKETVSELLGVPIDRYVIFHPSAVIKLIDLLGGITIYVDKDMYYVDNAQDLYVNIKKGWHHLSGAEAHGYLRFRMDPLGDINRVQRQQGFLGAIIKKLASPATIIKTPWVIGIARESIETDMSLKDIFRVGNLARSLSSSDFKSTVLPGGFSTDPTLPCFWIENEEETEKVLNQYFAKPLNNATKDKKTSSGSYVTIYNNTDNERASIPILKKLWNTKYIVSNIQQTSRDDFDKTEIIAQKGDEAGARELGDLIKINEIVVSSAGDITSDYTIILGKDYRN